MDKYSFLSHVNIICLNQEKPDRVFAENVKSLKKGLIKLIQKFLSPFIVYGSSKRYVKKVDKSIIPCSKYDIIISVSDPKSSHLALRKLLNQGLCCNKIIEYWGDPLVGDISKKIFIPKFILKIMEYNMLKISDVVYYTSPFTMESEKKLYPKLANKMKYTPTANISKCLFPETFNEIFTCGYFGAYYSNIRNILPLYEAFESLPYNLIIYGDTDLHLTSRHNIQIFPRGNVEKVEQITDLLIMIMNLSGTQIPGKVYHDASSNRPILVILDGDYRKEIKNYLESFNRYYFCNNDVESIRSALVMIFKEKNRLDKPCTAFDCKNIALNMINN